MFVPPIVTTRSIASGSVSRPPAKRVECAQPARTPPSAGSTPGFSRNFDRLAITATRPAVDVPEEALPIGRVDDPLEREAHRVADPASGTRDWQAPPTTGALVLAGAAPAVVHDVLRQSGHPLDDSTRTFFGRTFGADFHDVRLHTDALAERSAAAVDASAYTVGRHIVLGAGAPSLATSQGRWLLGHELTHVMQQAHLGPLLQRAPRGRPTTDRDAKPAAPANKPPLPEFVPADLVREIKRDNETWTLTVDGHTSPESLARALFPTIVPPGVTVRMKVAMADPIERGWFVIDGLTPTAIQVMEKSFAKLFADRGLTEEPPDSDELKEARTAFLKRHSDHSFANLLNMIKALERATKRNPELRLAYYRHYADNKLADETSFDDSIDFDPDVNAGASARGGTVIHPRVLDLTSKFPTDDALSLLASTMIHEFVHTPQGGGEHAVGAAPKEAKAYGVEKFFSERMGDRTRAAQISNMRWDSPLDVNTGADKVFRTSYNTMRALYEVIDQGGPAAKEARMMVVEFITNNFADYGEKLSAFIAKHG